MRAAWRMAASLILALAAAVSVYVYLDGLGKRYPVVVAAVPVQAGKLLSGADLRLVMFPGEAVHPQALTSLTDGMGRVTTVDLVPGEQILRSRICSREEAGVGSDLPPYMRAMLLPVPLERAGGGAATAGRVVDVLFVSDDRQQPATARVLERGVKVLGVRDERGHEWARGRETPLGVMVAVTPAQAERLAFALEHGSLYLALCPLEPEAVLTPGVSWESLYLPLPDAIAGEGWPSGTAGSGSP